MAMQFTRAQTKVLDARNHNILVSAAAGSGKTAVLVERIIRLISQGDQPLDIDRLLVVTFTRAAASQMRERIGAAISQKLREDPGNSHLQKQEVLLHNAQITTIDSFCTFLLRNYFSEIDLDPGFRQIDPKENKILAADVLADFLEEKYAAKDPDFLNCVEYFCPGTDDGALEGLILDLFEQAGSHPCPEAWLRDRAFDYDVKKEDDLFAAPWMQSLVLRAADSLLESEQSYETMQAMCLQPGGPDQVWSLLEEEKQGLFGEIRACRQAVFHDSGEDGPADPEELRLLWEEVLRSLARPFARYPALRGKKYDYMDPRLKETVKAMRDAQKDKIKKLAVGMGGQTSPVILATMASASGPMKTLASLALEYSGRLQLAKKERHVIDFVDLEHFALDILAERKEDATYVPRRAARALRDHYAEILIDEYQDSNEVQELLLQIISGEDEGRNNRFMVGDIKQSIYRFRLARPEIFMEKYRSYRPDDRERERIELDLNFRSRGEVLDCVNAVFQRIMRREIGGVDYTEEVSLKKGAAFFEDDPSDPSFRSELLLLDTADGPDPGDRVFPREGNEETSWEKDPDQETEDEGGPSPLFAEEISALTNRQKEALLIAGRIREIVGNLPIREEASGKLRPASYGDIVILVRSTVGWNEDLRAVFEREGIPVYAESAAGYFAAGEIVDFLSLLQVLDNPRQDIPLYAVMRGFFGHFTQDEITAIRLSCRDGLLYDALLTAAGQASPHPEDRDLSHGSGPEEAGDGRKESFSGEEAGDDRQESFSGEEAGDDRQESFSGDEGDCPVPPALADKCRDFLAFVRRWRERAELFPVTDIVNGLLDETGYQDYCTALPAGGQRSANLRLLRNQADAFARTDLTGLYHFLRYVEGLRRQEIDYGEANTLDENADVVRIMTIHKSKGLEFPICFVAGLAGRFSFRKFDASGPMLFDSDWGTGIRYYDPVSRAGATTLRREEIAEKIRRDCMGEELRVLYVAMTRAKEKLILTASMKGFAGKIEDWDRGMSGFYSQPDSLRLSPFMIAAASSYAELICRAVLAQAGPEAGLALFSRSGGGQGRDLAGKDMDQGNSADLFPLDIRLLTPGDLTMKKVEDQLDLSRCDQILRGLEGRRLDDQPDPAAAGELASRYFRVYPHEDLRGLFAQTSVSELKHRSMEEALVRMETDTAEGFARLFPDPVPVPYIPRFIRSETREQDEEEEISRGRGPVSEGGNREGTSREGGDGIRNFPDGQSRAQKGDDPGAGARRGTAVHRLLELFSYSHRKDLLARGTQGLECWIRDLTQKGAITPQEADRVSLCQLEHFLRSPLAARMEEADRKGLLFREQPFVMGCSAVRIGEGLPEGETVMVQGIIDAFFVEEGRITLVDYKTDRVRTGQELILRYRTQMELYAEALENAWQVPVAEKILYSLSLGAEVPL